MSKVAILKTSPRKVVSDYQQLIKLARYDKVLSKDNINILKLNLSWTLFYPACSTPPWQLEGVLNTLKDDKDHNVVAVENQTVVTHPWKGAYYNKWLPLLDKYDVNFQPPKTYCEGLIKALIGETNAVKKYRKILFVMTERRHINMLTEIITDEIRHGILYNLLVHNNDCKY